MYLYICICVFLCREQHVQFDLAKPHWYIIDCFVQDAYQSTREEYRGAEPATAVECHWSAQAIASTSADPCHPRRLKPSILRF